MRLPSLVRGLRAADAEPTAAGGARGLRSELAILIVLAMVPLAALSLGVMLWAAWLQQRSVEDGLVNTASALSLAVSRELETSKASLRAIALSSELEVGDFEALHRRVTPLARSIGGWVVLFRPDGTQLMNTLLPYGTSLADTANARDLQRVVQSQEATASDLFVGANAARHIVVVYEPIVESGVVRYVLGLGMKPERLSALLAVQPLPAGWYSVLSDSSGRVVARSVGGDQYVGRSAPEWFIARDKSAGILHGKALSGSDVLVAYQAMSDAPWTVSVVVPAALLARERTLVLVLLGIGALVLLALAVWLSGRVAARIAAPVRALADAAERGALPSSASASGLREFQELERALIRAAEAERERGTERERRLALEAANRAKDEFLATLSHELRTPLQASLGWLHVLRMAADDAQARNRAVPVIERNLRQLGQLVDDLIDASRIVSGKVALQLEPHDLAPLVRQTTETWQPSIAAKSQKLAVEVEDDTWVRCDRARFAQILSNLLANAVKFTPREGRIDVSLRTVGGEAHLTVSDSGVGIDSEALPNIFNKFWQVQGGSARRYQGLGLGLAIVKSLVELQGGHVRAASQGTGRGTTLTVVLPRIEAPAVQPAAERAPATMRPLEGARVLLIDDDVDAGGAIAQLLRLEGARVSFVNSVQDATDAVERESFDLALSDIAMPEQDGFDLLRELRRLRAQLPVIALTAFASDTDREVALAAGFDGFLAKPVDGTALTAAVLPWITRGNDAARPAWH